MTAGRGTPNDPRTARARRGPLRRLLFGAVACLITADVVGATAVGSASLQQQPSVAAGTGPTIPWVPAPYSAARTPQPLPYHLPDAAAPCAPAALRVTPTRSLGLAGSIVYQAKLTNVSAEVCSLRATPTSLRMVTPAGLTVPIGFTTPADGMALAASDVAPGDSGYLELNEGHECTAAEGNGYHTRPAMRLIVGLSTGGELVVGPPPLETYEFPCPPVEVSSLGVPAPAPTYAPSPYEGVVASLEIPSRVGQGRVLRYVVTVTDRTSHPIALAPCPNYNEAIYPESGRPYAQMHYDLNCSAVSRLHPGRPVRFAMALPVPSDFPVGPVQLGWSSAVIPSASNDPEVQPGAGFVEGHLLVTKR